MDYICYPLGYLMKWCHDFVGNYGLAIILFTLATKIVMLPLSVWVHKNSIKIVKIQPEVNFLKAKYYGDMERIADEEAKLHKREKYNPLISIIPLAVQIFLLLGVVYIIKAPLTHIFHLTDETCRALADAIGADFREGQLSVVRAVLDGTLTSDMFTGEAADAIGLISTLKLDFLGVSLDRIPSEVWGIYILVPIIAAGSSYLLCYVQNVANVIQAEQTKINKYGMTILSVGLSLYLGFFVYTGVALYWVASNVLAIVQQLILNAVINPKKYVDYDALEKSREELKKIRDLDGGKKDAESRANARREKEDYKRFFKVVNKHLVIYSERSGFYKYYEALIAGLLKKSNVVIHYVTNDPKDAIFDMAKENPRIRPYYIGPRKLITLMMRMDADVVVMTTPDLQTYYIKRSLVRKDVEYIYVPHDMMSVHMGFRKGSLDNFDTVFCTGPHVAREVRATEQVYGLPEKTLVEFGYPLAEKLEASCRAEAGVKNEKKEILIAPSWQEDNLLDSCVDTLIEKLLADDTHLTVRPHPEYSKRYPDKLALLTEKYKDVPKEKLTFELDFTTNRSIYSSDLLITDWSGIAYEFAFATKKPVLFVNTKMKVENPEWEKINMEPAEIYLRRQAGVALEKSELDGVKEAAEKLLSSADEYREKIDALKREHLYSYGTSGDVGVKYILSRLAKKQMENKNK
ncbi:MAG: membrane protein insertase YidC [Clostridia bacterium]|nr:membrane protein insertase YidC [Clostridia bacterium]